MRAVAAWVCPRAAGAPVSWWRLGDQSGSPAVDQQSANAGAYAGTVTYGEPSLIGGDTANKATAFNGVNGTVRVADSSSLDLTNAIKTSTGSMDNALYIQGGLLIVAALGLLGIVRSHGAVK